MLCTRVSEVLFQRVRPRRCLVGCPAYGVIGRQELVSVRDVWIILC
jgi:hypothetical protein